MRQLSAAALVLIAVIAFLMIITDLPWGTGPKQRSAAQMPAPTGGAMASDLGMQLSPHDSDAMAAMTRGVLRDLRRARPSSAERLQQVSQAADAAAAQDAMIALYRSEAVRTAGPIARPPAEISGMKTVAASGPTQSPRPAERRHIVADGETLTTIAMRAYGRASAWQLIYDENRDQLSRPDDLPVGAALRLPRMP